MNFMDYILMGISGIGIAAIVIIVIAASLMVTWWEATGGIAHENAKR